MKTFNDYITEEPSFRKKGWANIKSGKIVLWNFRGRSIRPYHTEYVTNNPKEFFPGGEEELLRKFADANGFEPDDIETQSMWSDLVKGKVDRDSNLDSIMNFAGWFRVVFDEGLCSIETQTTAEGRKVAKIIDKNIPWKRIESLYVYDKGHFDSATELHSEGDLQSYIKTGRVPKRTEIGSTLAMFREFAGDKESFRAHWKKAPIMKTGATDVKKRNAHWDSYFKHFEDKYGEIPNRIKNAMRMSDYKTNPSVTYKGRKFKLRTGMDEMDLLYHVLSEGKRIPKTRKNQDPDTHSDLYTDEDPKGTIHGLGFKDVKTAKASIVKIKKSGRTHAHKIQAAIAMEQRAKVMGKRAEAKVYRDFIEMMKKKTKEMNKEDWSDKYKKSIDCNNPKGFSQKAHCDGRAKRARGETTESEPVTEKTYAKTGLGKWFNQQSAGGGPGWDRYGTNGQKLGKCGDAKEGEPYSACLSRQKAQKLGKKKIASFVRRKRAAQDRAGRGDVGDGGKGKKPINVKTGVTDKDPKKKGIQDSTQKEQTMKSFKTYISEKNVPDNPELWKRAIAKAKSKFDVYPSAYANAWAAKWYKGEGGTWSVKKEEVENCDCGCDEIIETVIIYEEDGNKKKVKLNDPFRTPGGPKKFGVYVRNDKGNVVLVRFGDPNLSIKRDDPERLKSFRARHGCDKDPGPKWKAKYWSCKFWEKDKPVSGLLKKGKVS